MKEIHFYTNSKYIPGHIRYYDSWEETLEAICNKTEVHTVQMALLTTSLFGDGFRVYIHENKYDFYEVKLGSDNTRTDREIKVTHNLFRMWLSGEFDI